MATDTDIDTGSGSDLPTRPADLERVFALQHAASRREPYPTHACRRDRLSRLIDLLCVNQGALCAAVEADFGRRSAVNTRMFDILPPLNALKYARGQLAAWMRPARRRSSFPYNWIGAKSVVRYVPLGVVGNMSPWNFPLTLALSPLGGILAAGNRVMLKPSELTPRTSELLQDLISRTFAEDEIYVATGGVDVAGRFAALPFDHLLFTGSTEMGRRVAQTAALKLVPVTLELGGKSPVLVSETANIADAAAKVAFAKITNAGQICLAPDYLMIQRSKLEELVSQMTRAARAMYPQGTSSPDYVNIISERHAQRLRAHLADAVARGNRVIPLLDAADSADARCLAPHLVLMGEDGGTLMDEEIFGPVLPILAVDSFDQALERIGAAPRPLAVYYFGSDSVQIQRVAEEVACGGLVVNDLMLHFLQDELPFGGIGNSGMGSYHGPEGFQRFSHAKSVFQQSMLIDLAGVTRPPFGKWIRRVLNMQIKR